MRLRRVLFVASILSIASVGFSQSEEKKDKEVLSSFCALELDEQIKHGNNTFTEIYYFRVGEDGKATNIDKRLGRFTQLKNVQECLEGWKFTGFSPGTRFRVEFTWKHAFGWLQMKIIEKDFSQTTIRDK